MNGLWVSVRSSGDYPVVAHIVCDGRVHFHFAHYLLTRNESLYTMLKRPINLKNFLLDT